MERFKKCTVSDRTACVLALRANLEELESDIESALCSMPYSDEAATKIEAELQMHIGKVREDLDVLLVDSINVNLHTGERVGEL